MNEVFGEECFVGQICIVNNLKGRNDRKHLATAHEYVLMYALEDFESLGLPLTSKQLAEYIQADESGLKFQWRDLRKRGGADTRLARPNLYFPIYADPISGECSMDRHEKFSQKIFPLKSDGTDGCWRWGQMKVRHTMATLRATKVENKDRWNISYRVYLESDGQERVAKPKSVWFGPELSTDAATKALRSLIPEAADLTPKSVELVKTIAIQALDEGDLCSDFFAGSGATAHAVLELNLEDSGNRKYILVQLPEPTERQDYSTVAEFTKERLRRVGCKMRTDYPMLAIDIGFRSFKLDSSKSRLGPRSRRPLPIPPRFRRAREGGPDGAGHLVRASAQAGLDLTVPIDQKTIAGKAVHSIGFGSLMVCLAPKIDREDVEPLGLGIVAWHKELSPAGETQVVFRDSAFADDVAKTNLTAIVQQYGLGNVRSL